MDFLESYKKARIVVESRFKGLRHSHTTMIKSLITQVNHQTGVVENISYRDLSAILTVNSAPGRKESGTPSKQAIRNYIKSIERECGEYFQVVSEGQTLKFFFPEIPKIFKAFFHNTEIDTELNAAPHPKELGLNDNFSEEVNTEVNTEVTTPEFSAKNIKIKHNITNKLTSVDDSDFSKKLIQSNFQPSQETIDIALSRGLSQVTNHEEIQKFISYNQANGSLWADFNPVFLTWLERESEYRQTKQQQKYKLTRSNHDECRRTKNNSYDSLMAAVLRENSDACAPSEQFQARSIIEAELSHEQAHFVALGAANEHLRPALHQPEWEHGQRSMVRSTSGTNANGIGEWYESN